MGLRRLLPLLPLALTILLGLWIIRPAPVPPAEAQGVGIFARPDCSTITSAVTGSTWCFDSTASVLKVWNGTLWATTTLSNSGLSGFGGLFSLASCSTVNSPIVGQSFCFDQTSNQLKVWSGTNWNAQGMSPSVVSVTDYGAKCDGVTDDTAAIRNALNTAAATGIGRVLVPSNTLGCNFTGTIVVPRGIALEGAGAGAASIANSGSTAFLNHAFSGTGLQLDGSSAGNPGSGYNLRNLAIRQTNGTGTTTAGDGTAIRIVCTGANTRATWVRMENVNIEEGSGNNPWTIGIDIDGTGCYGLGITSTVRDVWMTNGRIQVGATTGTPFGLRVRFAANVFVTNMEFTNFAHLQFTGQAGSESNSILITNSQGPTIALDFVTNLIDIGGQYTTLTTTANAAGPVVLYPLYITNAFTNNAPTKIMVAQFNTAVLGANFNQGWNLGTPLLMGNGNSGGLGFLNAAGTSYEQGMTFDGSNRLQVGNSAGVASIQVFKTANWQSGAVQSGSPTGGDTGTGTFNAGVGYYANNNQVINASGSLINRSFTFANLNLVLTANGMQIYCSDCAAASALDQTCVGGGSGNLAVRVNGIFKCAY